MRPRVLSILVCCLAVLGNVAAEALGGHQCKRFLLPEGQLEFLEYVTSSLEGQIESSQGQASAAFCYGGRDVCAKDLDVMRELMVEFRTYTKRMAIEKKKEGEEREKEKVEWEKYKRTVSEINNKVENFNYCSLVASGGDGLWLTYYGHVLKSADVYKSLEVESYWTCQTICKGDRKCSTCSAFKTEEGPFSCSLSTESIPDLGLIASASGVTIAKNNHGHYMGEDGVFYSIVRRGYNVKDSRDLCGNKFKRGRLITPKTRTQFKSVQNLRAITDYLLNDHYFLVDLRWDSNLKDAVWGDGTLFSNSEVAETQQLNSVVEPGWFELRGNGVAQYFKGASLGVLSFVMCEMNPLRYH